MREQPAQVTVAMANYNTRLQTRLALDALSTFTSREQYRLRMGDCGSTDGSLEMLVRDLHAGKVDELEVAPSGRRHAAWIDLWIATCDTPYLLLMDSDLEIRKANWLDRMLDRMTDADFVAAEMYPDQPDYIDGRDGTRRSLGSRPGVHLMLLDVSKAREVKTSFEESFRPSQASPPFFSTEKGWDVGGAFMAKALEQGLVVAEMDPAFADSFRHWIGASWDSGRRRGLSESALRSFGLRARILAHRAPLAVRPSILARIHRPRLG